jgi:DNA-binding response OmpR family regulator/anti-sigma regulatory factor (Ser/Thr protein kinase)
MSIPLRVLIVEDSEDDAALLLRELRRGGYNPTFARVDTPTAMSAALAQQAWDIVIADYAMPHFNAPAALTLVQESGLDLPFIVVSGAIGDATAVAAMQAGAQDYIMKDNLARLNPAIERELREATERRERKWAEEEIRRLNTELGQRTRATNVKRNSGDNEVEILIVEDSHTQAVQLEYMLEQHGYQVAVAQNGKEALAALSRHKPTLVISDINMPEMDGYQLCQQIKADEHLKDLPVILLTALADPEDVIKGLDCGADNFITKPYNERHLLSRIRYFLLNGELGGMEKGHMGLEIFFSGQKRLITSDRLQILNLLLSTYETALQKNRELVEAQDELRALNEQLEAKVEERTAALRAEITERKRAEEALARANTELQRSLEQQEQAYRNLQRSQENLIQAEKMAALGQLAAGIAHEMNTPLGASMTSLKLIQELVAEYQASIDDPETGAQDHREIAAEMAELVHSIQQWLEKTTLYIRSLKLHTRNLQQAEERVFSVRQVIEDVGLLLSHHLRLSQCSLSVCCAASDPMLYGDPGKLGQVLTNLMVNAIDAYKDTGRERGEVRVEVGEDGDFLQIRVKDQGCGIAPESREKIFDEFFSTKPPGEGTGLGLPIARDIVSNFFAGTISVESAPGEGSTFILRLARDQRGEEE